MIARRSTTQWQCPSLSSHHNAAHPSADISPLNAFLSSTCASIRLFLRRFTLHRTKRETTLFDADTRRAAAALRVRQQRRSCSHPRAFNGSYHCHVIQLRYCVCAYRAFHRPLRKEPFHSFDLIMTLAASPTAPQVFWQSWAYAGREISFLAFKHPFCSWGRYTAASSLERSPDS